MCGLGIRQRKIRCQNVCYLAPDDLSANLYEHSECVRFGSAPTSCPSARIPWDRILSDLSGQPGQPPGPAAAFPSGKTILVHMDDGASTVMDVDEYVKGVLPYEMATGWPLEALKAQAVVGKSYALSAREVFTDTRSQVYGPLRYPDTDAAAEAVRGMYVGYQGQIVMPFYFGHCNGSTRSPSQAGWSAVADRPYLQGVVCMCGRTSYFGHGIGMCQRGAQAMAEQGASFDQILRHYYQGIEIMGFQEGASVQALPPANAEVYVVKTADTLLSIAAAFHIEWPAVYTANRDLIADPNVLNAGWQLVIPRGAGEQGEPGVYVVQPGDTLFSLSRRWGCNVADIVARNAIPDERLIRVGQRLFRP